jgi:predicted nucleic acid-binding protein
MKAVFADTFYWIALTNPRDGFHDRVLEFSRSLRPLFIVTTDEVLTKLLTFSAADPQLRLEASLVVNDVLADENIRVIPQTRRSFLVGFALYQSRPDKGYSLTDCTSMQTMRHSGLTDVLTNDKHFEQEGFRALFRDS